MSKFLQILRSWVGGPTSTQQEVAQAPATQKRSWFGGTSPIEKRDAIAAELAIAQKMLMSEKPELSRVRLTLLSGDRVATIKLLNNDNLRMIRIEIPMPGNPERRICVYSLERTHNVVEDIDHFYDGEMQAMTFDEVMESAAEGRFFNEWLLEEVDRSQDVARAWAYRLPHAAEIPPDLSCVYIGIIQSSDVLCEAGGVVQMELSFVGVPGSRKVGVKKELIYSYSRGSIFVINSKERHAAFSFNKAKKFLRVNQDDWGYLKSYYQPPIPRSPSTVAQFNHIHA